MKPTDCSRPVDQPQQNSWSTIQRMSVHQPTVTVISDHLMSKADRQVSVTCCRCCRISCLFSVCTFASWTVSSVTLLRSSLIFNRPADNIRRAALFDTLPPWCPAPTLEVRLLFRWVPSWLGGGLLLAWPKAINKTLHWITYWLSQSEECNNKYINNKVVIFACYQINQQFV